HAEGKLVKSQPTRLLLKSLAGLPVEFFLFGSQTIEIDSYTCFQVYVFHLSSPHLNPLGQQLKMNSVPFKVHSVLPEHFSRRLEKASNLIHLFVTRNDAHYPLVLIRLTLPPPAHNPQVGTA